MIEIKKSLVEKVYFIVQKADYVYLGRRVKDIGKPGLDTIKEVEGICQAIIDDYKNGRISYRTAMSRMNLLSLIVKKSKKFPVDKKPKAREIIDKYREELKKLKEEKENKKKK